ncbi:hypothetical protein [Burkholderia latens]|uniref:hypothetical protein n=1 Tax=Burkholderia latens TaxID=488446 RepID=UPI0012E33DD8|nr:hypothetical protein [Burkholderia latens]
MSIAKRRFAKKPIEKHGYENSGMTALGEGIRHAGERRTIKNRLYKSKNPDAGMRNLDCRDAVRNRPI